MPAPRNLDKLQIVVYPHPVLKKRCAKVETFDSELRTLANRMLTLMHEAPGVGLAAPQVGESIRMFVCNVTGEPDDDVVAVNPWFTDLIGTEEREEGCLSLPNVQVQVRRATHAVMEAQDLDGKLFHISAEDLQARVLQHEADHLDGRLIIDNMSPTDEIATRRFLKQLQADYRA